MSWLWKLDPSLKICRQERQATSNISCPQRHTHTHTFPHCTGNLENLWEWDNSPDATLLPQTATPKPHSGWQHSSDKIRFYPAGWRPVSQNKCHIWLQSPQHVQSGQPNEVMLPHSLLHCPLPSQTRYHSGGCQTVLAQTWLYCLSLWLERITPLWVTTTSLDE